MFFSFNCCLWGIFIYVEVLKLNNYHIELKLSANNFKANNPEKYALASDFLAHRADRPKDYVLKQYAGIFSSHLHGWCFLSVEKYLCI